MKSVEKINKCLICYTSNKNKKPFKKLPSCSCNFCPDCLTNWVLERLKLMQNSATEFIRCPQSLCSQKYLVEEYALLLTSQHKNKLFDALAIKYCQITPEIRNCPSPLCENYGFINEKTCNKSLICPVCNSEWEDLSVFYSFKSTIKTINTDIFSMFYKEIFTNQCPTCNINIEKNGGCKHITCSRCNWDFCWDCKQDWYNHDNSICDFKMIAYAFILMFIFLLSFQKLGLIFMIKSFILKFSFFEILAVSWHIYQMLIIGCFLYGFLEFIYYKIVSIRRFFN